MGGIAKAGTLPQTLDAGPRDARRGAAGTQASKGDLENSDRWRRINQAPDIIWSHWRNGRVVEGGSLENCYAERHRGFESYRLRHIDSLNPMQAFYVLAVFQIAGQGSVDVRKGSAEEDQQTGLCGKCSAEKPAIVFRHHRPPCSRSTSSRLAEPATRTCIVEPLGARGSTRFRIPSKNYRSFIGT